jgi:hypothetical protein
MHPYQLLWQDARSGSHSGGGHVGRDESLFSGVSTHPPCSPANFLDVLRGWGQTWIWDDLKVTGGTD